MPRNIADLAMDLTRNYPRSARDLFAGYIIVGRMLDKCRATLNGTQGEYCYNSRIDWLFLEFAGLDADEFKDFVATGVTDEEIADWIHSHAAPHTPAEIAAWNFKLKCGRISDLPPEQQAWMQDYMLKHVKQEVQRRVVFNFDMLDAEEGRLG